MSKKYYAYCIEINNPLDKGFTREKIIDICRSHNPRYFCISDEIAAQLHTHIYIYFNNQRHFNSIMDEFSFANEDGGRSFSHIEAAKGSAKENRDYVFKEGKYEGTEWIRRREHKRGRVIAVSPVQKDRA